MACNKCKKKQEKEQILKQINRTEKKVIYIFIGMIALALYGVYSLIF